LVFQPALLIPCYNHGDQIDATVSRLAHHRLPCLIVDDGSDATTAAVLDRLAAEHDWLTLVRLPENRGKGAAMAAGVDAAAEAGWTHVLQIDADGQHDTDDIPRLLDKARDQPDALVSGQPIYDDDIPRVRFYGRYLTHALVWLQTLSFAIRDSMCGFRVYPVVASRDLFHAHRIGRRMDFDTDIMVRLYWRGTPVVFVPTRVRYPRDGVSHFDMLGDNLRIAWMHARLICGMVPRAPLLVARRLRRGSEKIHWTRQVERGTYWLMWLSLQLYRVFGRPGARLVLYPLVTWYWLSNAQGRRASRDFLQRVYEHGGAQQRPPRALDVYRHFFMFSDCIVDRLESWRGRLRHEHVQFNGQQMLLDEAARGRGAILMTSHLGNIELCRGLNDQLRNLRMNVLVYNHHAPRINRIIEKSNPNSRLKLVDIREFGMQTAAMLEQQVRDGEFLAIAADRTPPSLNENVVPARFLGSEAPFPTGPFIIAALLHCPVYLMTCVRVEGRYRIDVVHFAEEITLSRKNRDADLQYWAQRYADDLEARALETPMQWFNFYDFWGHPVTGDDTPRKQGGHNGD
jgi:predicted LPLAT superfamily acyltransferase/GT2 family glycosyltransferase